MHLSVVIVAGGSGTRMGNELPKQFLSLSGTPILIRTIAAFRSALPEATIRVVLPPSHQELATEMLREHDLLHAVALTEGGTTRFESVKNGIFQCDHPSLILVHDAVRCLVSPQLIQRCVAHAIQQGTAIPVVAVRDSMRKVVDTRSEVVSREGMYSVQTPQVFSSVTLRAAFHQPYRQEFTDEASVVEAAGHEVSLVEGEHRNIKITFPEDLIVATCMLQNSVD
ncbi:MAG: 2-C-methyl-D-erythritol 4-phosphate cytidylyltransferase [Bacteroidota bacterium]